MAINFDNLPTTNEAALTVLENGVYHRKNQASKQKCPHTCVYLVATITCAENSHRDPKSK